MICRMKQKYWRNRVKDELGYDLYSVASIGHENQYDIQYIDKGCGAANEFSPGPYILLMEDITKGKNMYARFFGERCMTSVNSVNQKNI